MADPPDSKIILLRDFKEIHAVYLFADIRGFTDWSRKNQSEVRKLTRLMYSVAVTVFGTKKSSAYLRRVVKFLGDGFFAVAEYDEERPEETRRKLSEMVSSVIQFNDALSSALKNSDIHGRTKIAVGYGLTYGPSFRFQQSGQPADYIGNPINLASRLCGIAKPNHLAVESDVPGLLTEISPEEKLWISFSEIDDQIRSFEDVEVQEVNLVVDKRKRAKTVTWVMELIQDLAKRSALADDARSTGSDEDST